MCAPADIFLSLLAILFPPLPVWIKTGICSAPSLLNLLLCLLGYLPGLLHAWYIIAAMPDPSATAYYYEEISTSDPEAARRTTRYEARRQDRSRSNAYFVVSRVPGPNGPAAVYGGGSAPNGYVVPPQQIAPRSYGGTAEAPAAAGPSSGEEMAPPSYDQAVRGDNKVQK